MEQKIQLKHPAGKKAVRMDKSKYDAISHAILTHLRNVGESTHSGILRAITEEIRRSKMSFEGSIEWHMEWVKLDLEARNEIKRSENNSPITFTIA